MSQYYNSFNSGWYLIYTRPRHEKKVVHCLSEIPMVFYLPTVKKLRTWNDRRKYVDEPLFPSYVFIYLNNFRDYYNSLNIDGVLYYVRTGKEIVRVNESVINSIRLVVNEGGGIEVSDNSFQPGQQLVIQHGPLTGLSCEAIHNQGKEKLLVRIHLLQRSLLISMPAESLLPVQASA